MRILGIDPGTAITGYGLIESDGSRLQVIAYESIETSSQRSLPERILTIHSMVSNLIKVHKPDQIAVEQLFFNKNTRTALSVGQARGVVLLAGAQNGLEIEEYTPLQVKQAVAGHGTASKDQVQSMVRILLGLEKIPRPDDVADALAVAICHAHSFKLKRLYGER